MSKVTSQGLRVWILFVVGTFGGLKVLISPAALDPYKVILICMFVGLGSLVVNGVSIARDLAKEIKQIKKDSNTSTDSP